MKILVVDDEPAVCDMADELLTDAGYDVLIATDGLQAIALAYEKHPDLIVLDNIMPKMTGSDVVREIRKDPRVKNTPILIMSALVSESNLDASIRDLDVAGFMDKSQVVTLLVSRVQQLLTVPNPHGPLSPL